MNIDILKNEGEDILTAACLGKLRQALGSNFSIRLKRRGAPDHELELWLGDKPPLKLAVEVKRRIVSRNQAFPIIHRFRDLPCHGVGALVFSDWIAESVAEEFRKAGVFFADAEGNAFIRKPPWILVDIRGKKPMRPLKAEPGRLIEPAGLKALHYLLTRPEVLGQSLRAIGEGAEVSLGTVHLVMKELWRGQWLLPARGGGRRFGNLNGLVELFIRGYGLKLRPACLLGRYRHQERLPANILKGFSRRLEGLEGHWAVTGGMAAREITHHLEPDTVALLVDEQSRTKLEGEPMLRDEEGGNVVFLRLFGSAAIAGQSKGPWPMATPLLVYAELLEAGGARDLEAARMIYERFLEPGLSHGT